MELNAKIQSLENEINLLKLEMKQVLVDLRDAVLQSENPFAPRSIAMPPTAERERDADDSPEGGAPRQSHSSGQAHSEQPETAVAVQSLSASGDASLSLPAKQPDNRRYHGDASHSTSGQIINAMAATAPDGRDEAGAWGMLTVASLAKWVDQALKKVGKERFEAILEIYELTSGHKAFTAEIKQALVKMALLADTSAQPEVQASMNDSIALLTQLDALLRTNGRSEATILSILTEMNLL